MIIKQYIDKITKNDIYNFGIQNNIYLNTTELEEIYKYIKYEWQTIIFGDINPIFNNLEKKINEENLIKIKKLYFEFKKKYKNFL